MKRHSPLRESDKELLTIPGIGDSLARDLVDLGIHRVRDLKDRDPERLYRKLLKLRGMHIDRCVLYTFRCAVYYATENKHDPQLLKWWNWKDGKAGKPGEPAGRVVSADRQSKPQKGMWACPECGHRFLRRNRTHSCGNYRIDDHFRGTSETTRKLFEAFRKKISATAPVTVYAQKTGIIFHLRHRFALAVARKNWLDIALCLWKPRKHRSLRKIEYFEGRCHRHWFRISQVPDMDDAFLRLLKESCEVGS